MDTSSRNISDILLTSHFYFNYHEEGLILKKWNETHRFTWICIVRSSQRKYVTQWWWKKNLLFTSFSFTTDRFLTLNLNRTWRIVNINVFFTFAVLFLLSIKCRLLNRTSLTWCPLEMHLGIELDICGDVYESMLVHRVFSVVKDMKRLPRWSRCTFHVYAPSGSIRLFQGTQADTCCD